MNFDILREMAQNQSPSNTEEHLDVGKKTREKTTKH